MREFSLFSDNSKIYRELPETWDDSRYLYAPSSGIFDFSNYVLKLHKELKNIKRFYEKEFNSDDTNQFPNGECNTIDDYIDVVEESIIKINKLIMKKSLLKNMDLENYVFDRDNSFAALRYDELEKLDESAFITNRTGKINGFKPDIYKKIQPIAKELFWVEKACSAVTRKIWKKEITNVKDLDLKKPFKIIARVVMPNNWRLNYGTTNYEVEEYYKNKRYSSASLIDEKNKSKLFMYDNWKSGVAAILILEYDENKFICADSDDCFSEEFINEQIPLEGVEKSTSVNKLDEVTDNNNHAFYSRGVEIATPQSILEEILECSEVNMKDAKVVGVIAPNIESLAFAEHEAEKRKVPLFFDDLSK